MPRPPVPELLSFRHADKLLHFIGYALLGALSLLGAGARGRVRHLLTAWLAAALYGVADELHQGFVPGRSASSADVLADWVGAAAGVAVLALVSRAGHRRAR